MTQDATRRRSATRVPNRRSTNTRRAHEARRERARRRRRATYAAAAVLAAVVAGVAVAATSGHHGSTATGVGARAPDGTFTTAGGGNETVASLRGQPALVWFVATWCSSCQAGTQAMASEIGTFAAHGVRVVELEMADDLGQSGPSIEQFGQQLAGAAYTNRDWTWGVASSGLTSTYDPNGYLDIYYLIDASGRIAYVNGSPGSTMGQLLAQVARVGTHG